MAYTIYPQIQYRYDCNTIVVYNDIYNDMATEEDSSATLSSISFNIQQYGDVSAPSYTATASNVNGTWATIGVTGFNTFRFYPTTDNPTIGQSYDILITFDDASTETLSQTAVSGDSWKNIMLYLANDDIDSSVVYDSETASMYITNGLKTISTVVISDSNSDCEIEEITQSDLTTFIEDVYTITVDYVLSDASTGSNTYYLPIYCSSKKCILTELSKVQDILDCSSCDNACVDYIMNAVTSMETLRAEINNTEDIIRAQDTIERLEDFCDNKDCNCT